MYRLLLASLLFLAGCQNLVGPRERRDNPQRPDDPRLTIPEQERKGRDQLALPEWSPKVAPTDPGLLPGPYGR
jgi:hypothetical protein